MTDPELRQLADALSQALRPHLERSEPVRRVVALVGRWLCEEAGLASSQVEGKPPVVGAASAKGGGTPAAPDSRPAPDRPSAPPPHGVPAPRLSSALVPLKLGDAMVHVPLTGTTQEIGRARQAIFEGKPNPEDAPPDFTDRDDIDLALIETRCRLKAAACNLFIERRATLADADAELASREQMNAMIARAKAMHQCYLAVFRRDSTQPDDDSLRTIAAAYEAQAEAVALVRKIDAAASGPTPADGAVSLHLLAEANSALRVALADARAREDRDQDEAHLWLRRETAARRVFVTRHMTVDDPADPLNSADVRERIAQLSSRIDNRASKAKDIKAATGTIRYEARQIVRNGPDDSPAHWAKVSEAIARLVGMGVAATDRRVVDALGAEAAAMHPVDAPASPSLRSLLEAAERPPAGEDAPSAPDREWSASVLEVRELLRGKRIVIIGGERKTEAVARFVDAFELADAEWVPLTEHGPGTPMRGPISRTDTAAVIVIIKLAGHLHVDEAKELAAAADKPCVLLTAGYNPEQVASAILEQASVRLRR